MECEFSRVVVQFSDLSEAFAIGFVFSAGVILSVIPVRLFIDWVRSMMGD